MRSTTRHALLPLVLTLLTLGQACDSCEAGGAGPGVPESELVDHDRDGYCAVYDCDDEDPHRNFGLPEVCDGLDNDCDELLADDEVDADRDGFYVCGALQDCDDEDPLVHPAAQEFCNGIDDSCTGVIDDRDRLEWRDYYPDEDGDGFGDGDATPVEYCASTEGWARTPGDCDDSAPGVHPLADEVCDGLDNDCDGTTDEELGPIWYRDADGDGYGDEASAIQRCEGAQDEVLLPGDCDDLDATRFPGATEVCNDIDDDCSGEADEDLSHDADADGHTTPDSCAGTRDDCDDSAPDVFPGHEETCEGIDNDCDGTEAGCAIMGDFSLADADAKLLGEAAGGYFGQTVGGWGYPDGSARLVVSAPLLDEVSVFNPPIASEAGPSTRYLGLESGAQLGACIATTTAAFEDGERLLLGAPQIERGRLFAVPPTVGVVELPGVSAALNGEGSGADAGAQCLGGVDLNDDGVEDVVVSAPGEGVGGAVYVVFGPISGASALSGSDVRLYSDLSDSRAGLALTAGDLDGDGIGDLVVGLPAASAGAGEVRVFLGPIDSTLTMDGFDATILGSADDALGTALVALDVDLDGSDELFVGAPSAAALPIQGEVLRFDAPLGLLGASDASDQFIDDEPGTRYGQRIEALDFNGDGWPDLAISAIYSSRGTFGGGAVQLLYGSAAGPVEGAWLLGTATASFTGTGLGVGDFDSDGFDDVAIGAPGLSESGTAAGAVYLVSGGPR